MASIFTYEPEPPRVASPWLRSVAPNELHRAEDRATHLQDPDHGDAETSPLNSGNGDEGQVVRLQAEPQDGPVEYKLHLLLRPRRKFRSISTGTHISGSIHSRLGIHQSSRSVLETAVDSPPPSGSTTPQTASTMQMRQHRLEQLTTQLLWRLQQSSPHHTSSATNIILPSLPEALSELQAPLQPAKLLHGLEESQGALYEIGVSDDGTLVGLAEDEMHESLNNLRAMAACLGCTVDVRRRKTVGECEWLEDATVGRKERKVRRMGKLVVAEALVKPCLQGNSPSLVASDPSLNSSNPVVPLTTPELSTVATEQLRITLTGPTMSGKSTLLGTLTTSTVDNGRGKSRLSMLKHRHEITSGVTSSITQELIGYQDVDGGDVEVVNFATENVASWIDIHVGAAGSRLVLISDSAGHPRYRRTTIKGLVGWVPHWTLLCVPADDTEDSVGKTGSTYASQRILGTHVSDMDLSAAQMDLCLRLQQPLMIVITKLDLASRAGLKDTLTKVLDALKAAGRKPSIIKSGSGAVAEEELQIVKAALIENAYDACLPTLNDSIEFVPIVLTSAVQGTGISNLHALLHELPLPGATSGCAEIPPTIFHIEDIYSKPAEVEGFIVSGYLRPGSKSITVGDSMLLGPFSLHDQHEESEDSDDRPAKRSSSHLPASRSFPGALRDSHFGSHYLQLPGQEWRRIKVTSIRNLRLPVHSLFADQVGTIAIVPHDNSLASLQRLTLSRIRKGMVLAASQPLSARSFVAQFRREDVETLAVGNSVVVYITSVRAAAKVISARAPDSPNVPRHDSKRQSTGHDPFDFEEFAGALDDASERVAGSVTAPNLLVTFTFEQSKEFLVVGDQVLVMPGGGLGLYGGQERGEKGMAGLEGFVGKIEEISG